MNPPVGDYLVSIGQLLAGTRTRDEQALAAERQHDLAAYLDFNRPQRVLDLANGRLRPQYLLLQAAGHRVVGIDWVNRPASTWTDRGYRFARWLYTRHISYPPGAARANTLVCGDAGSLPFAPNSFDLVTSIAAFEHFLDVPAVVSALHQVLRPGGLAYIRIHPFTCPSGGHNLKFTEIPLRSIPSNVDAWDHLRKRRLPAYDPLNGWRPGQYLEAVSRHFEVLDHFCAMREGEHLLTPQIAAELSSYSRDELTCGAYVILARKPVL